MPAERACAANATGSDHHANQVIFASRERSHCVTLSLSGFFVAKIVGRACRAAWAVGRQALAAEGDEKRSG